MLTAAENLYEYRDNGKETGHCYIIRGNILGLGFRDWGDSSGIDPRP